MPCDYHCAENGHENKSVDHNLDLTDFLMPCNSVPIPLRVIGYNQNLNCIVDQAGVIAVFRLFGWIQKHDSTAIYAITNAALPSTHSLLRCSGAGSACLCYGNYAFGISGVASRHSCNLQATLRRCTVLHLDEGRSALLLLVAGKSMLYLRMLTLHTHCHCICR